MDRYWRDLITVQTLRMGFGHLDLTEAACTGMKLCVVNRFVGRKGWGVGEEGGVRW